MKLKPIGCEHNRANYWKHQHCFMTAKSFQEQMIRLFHFLQLSPASVTGYNGKSGDYLDQKIMFNPIVAEERF